MTRLTPGYEADDYQAVWDRPKPLGAPKGWTSAWFILCMYGALLAILSGQYSWLLYLGVGWFFGQAGLTRLTQWDPDWDRLLAQWCLTGIKRLRRTETGYYKAG